MVYVLFKFSAVYKEDEDDTETYPLDYTFSLSYEVISPEGEVKEEDKIYYDGSRSSDFRISKEIDSGDEIKFTVDSIKDIFELDSKDFYIEGADDDYFRHEFVLTRVLDMDEISGKMRETFGRGDILLTEYDRVFGNNDVLIIWHDGKAMNLKSTQSVSSNYESQITDKNVDISRMGDKSFISKSLDSVELEVVLGDIWKKDSINGSYKKQNRSSALRTIYELYKKNIPINFRSDIKNIDIGIITYYDVSQSTNSDNTYNLSCIIKEVNFIDRLPQTKIKREEDGTYTEIPEGSPFELELTYEEEEKEIDYRLDRQEMSILEWLFPGTFGPDSSREEF